MLFFRVFKSDDFEMCNLKNLPRWKCESFCFVYLSKNFKGYQSHCFVLLVKNLLKKPVNNDKLDEEAHTFLTKVLLKVEVFENYNNKFMFHYV